MSQDRKPNMNVYPCPHVGSQHLSNKLDIQQLVDKLKSSCNSCDYVGANLWICLQRNCLHVGCPEQANDHSTEHFQRNNTHCVHLNLSSQRAWCYLCEREVFLGAKPGAVMSVPVEPFAAATASFTSIDYEQQESSASGGGSGAETGLVGLQNIANTCYMNSALQALSNVQPMTHYFLNCGDLVEYTAEQGALRSKAGLAKSYQRLMRDIWLKEDDGDAKIDCVAPRGILYGIRSVHPMFRGFQQHDTQEFLRCFMDQLHEELKEQSPTASLISVNANATINSEKLQSNSSGTDDEYEHEQGPLQESSSSSLSSLSDEEYETCDSSVSEHSGRFVGKLRSASASLSLSGRSYRSGSGAAQDSETTMAPQSQSQAQIQQQATDRSIISDVFDGKLLSSVQCLTCDRISTREETFQDLSLPIPNRDHLNLLHQTHSLSVQSLNSIESSNSRGGSAEGWLSWMWNLLRSWLWGPSVTLHDCMASFFSADELKGDNMYSCEKCNKLRTGVKYSQILDLPEVLCIHLKRFRHDLAYSSKISSHVNFPLENFDMRPYLHKDCKSHVALYKLSSVICHHGTVGSGHYTCIARNAFNNRWYEYDDQHVTEVLPDVVQNCQAYVLFYHKHNPQMELVRAEARELSVSHPVQSADIRFYVSREWLARFNTFGEPGPINNWAMLCPHGGLLQSKIALLSQIAVPIAQPLWDFLYRKFGGGPVVNMLFECEVCKRAAEALARRQYYELAVFTKYNGLDVDVDASAIYAISMPWLRKWQQFARGLTHKEPGPITNANIAALPDAAQTTSPIRNVRPGSDYAQINASLWRFLHGIYSGGPEIILRGSVTEEIEIIDQDEYEYENTRANPDLSDTESNIGQPSSMPDLSNGTTGGTSESTDANRAEADKEFDPLINAYPPYIREPKYGKRLAANSKKPKPHSLHSSFRRKTKKSRNAMKNADFFGPKGSYNQNDDMDIIECVSPQRLDANSTDSAAYNAHSIAFDKPHTAVQQQAFQTADTPRISSPPNGFMELPRSPAVVDFDNAFIRRMKSSKRHEEPPVLLQKYNQCNDSGGSHETDA